MPVAWGSMWTASRSSGHSRAIETRSHSIVNASFDRFVGVAVRLVRDSQLAQDAVQRALLDIWRDLPRLRDPDRFDAWSYRVLVRACYAEYRNTPRWMPAIEAGMRRRTTGFR